MPKEDIWERERERWWWKRKEREEKPFWFLYQHVSLTRRIYEEKECQDPGVDHILEESSSKCLHNPLWVFTPPPRRRYLRSPYKTRRRPRGESPKMTMPLTSALPVPNVQEIQSTRRSSRTAGGRKGRKSNLCTAPPSLLRVVDLTNSA